VGASAGLKELSQSPVPEAFDHRRYVKQDLTSDVKSRLTRERSEGVGGFAVKGDAPANRNGPIRAMPRNSGWGSVVMSEETRPEPDLP
jgi:hypothetical protein